ncbi:MAG: hypothetical protein V3V08_03670 [Nannocystaceae bacterium]
MTSPTRAIATLVTWLCFSSCGQHSSLQWTDALRDIEISNQTIFSFMYLNEPPDGSLLRAAIFPEQTPSPCALFDELAPDETDTFWWLHLTVGSAHTGSYDITPYFGEERDLAKLDLISVDGGSTVIKIGAVHGTIHITQAVDTLEKWHSQTDLELEIEAEFPASPVFEIECNDSGDANGTTFFSECICENLEGERSTCEPEDPTSLKGCCAELEGPRIHFSNKLRAAARCPAMCAWANSYPQGYVHCDALNYAFP